MIGIDKQRARVLVDEYLEKNRRVNEMLVVEEATREEDFGWVFFYQSRLFVETGDRKWAVGGNAPLIVDRRTGELHVTGTAHPIQHYIDDYRRRGRGGR